MMGTWNAYVWPKLVAPKPEYQLVSNALIQIYSSVDSSTAPETAYQMAAAVMITVPLLIVFLALRKQIMNGVSRSGIKG